MTTLSNTEVRRQFTVYHQLIQNAKSIETDKSLRKQYDDHLNSLNEIEAAFNNKETALLTKLIEQESRFYGWSYLPNDYGKKVETSFWEFVASLRLNLVFIIGIVVHHPFNSIFVPEHTKI